MSRIATLITAVIVAALAIGIVVMGTNLVMPLARATEIGVGAGPWFLVWGMITTTALCSIALIAYLFSGLSGSRR